MLPEQQLESEALLTLEFRPFWDFIDDARRFVESFCKNAKVQLDRAEGVGMAVHELLQNAVKYSEDGVAWVTVGVDAGKNTVFARVRSTSAPEHLVRLENFAKKINAEPDPLKCYVDMMHDSVGREGSGLGLARIRCEGQLQLDIRVEGRSVVITALGSAQPTPENRE